MAKINVEVNTLYDKYDIVTSYNNKFIGKIVDIKGHAASEDDIHIIYEVQGFYLDDPNEFVTRDLELDEISNMIKSESIEKIIFALTNKNYII